MIIAEVVREGLPAPCELVPFPAKGDMAEGDAATVVPLIAVLGEPAPTEDDVPVVELRQVVSVPT